MRHGGWQMVEGRWVQPLASDFYFLLSVLRRGNFRRGGPLFPRLLKTEVEARSWETALRSDGDLLTTTRAPFGAQHSTHPALRAPLPGGDQKSAQFRVPLLGRGGPALAGPGWVSRHATQRSGQLRFSGDLENRDKNFPRFGPVGAQSCRARLTAGLPTAQGRIGVCPSACARGWEAPPTRVL
jgi:hypothetical protein